MGYPMTYPRVVNRNGLATGDYDSTEHGLLLGDLRRFESDTLDGRAICERIAAHTGHPKETVLEVLTALFNRQVV